MSLLNSSISTNLKVLRVVVFENMFRSVTVPDALAHAGVVALVTEDLAAQQLGGHGVECC